MPKSQVAIIAKPGPEPGPGVQSKFTTALLRYAAKVPPSKVTPSQAVPGPIPEAAARNITQAAARKAALAAGSLALPVGPLGWLTVLPEMVAVWKIQSQMVADLAALQGQSAGLTPTHMLYCLFKHSAAQAVRDLGVRVGERLVFKQGSLKLVQAVALALGKNITQRAIGKSASRWLPLVGAMGVGAYAYYDTVQVAKTTAALLQSLEVG